MTQPFVGLTITIGGNGTVAVPGGPGGGVSGGGYVTAFGGNNNGIGVYGSISTTHVQGQP